MPWYRKDVGSGVPGIEEIERLSRLVMEASVRVAAATGDASGVAMFWLNDRDADRHYAYFPPSSENIARTLVGFEETADPVAGEDFSLQVAANADAAWAQVPQPEFDEDHPETD